MKTMFYEARMGLALRTASNLGNQSSDMEAQNSYKCPSNESITTINS